MNLHALLFPLLVEINGAGLQVARRLPTLTEAQYDLLLLRYRDYFDALSPEQPDNPPTSKDAEEEVVLTAIWDKLVDLESSGRLTPLLNGRELTPHGQLQYPDDVFRLVFRALVQGPERVLIAYGPAEEEEVAAALASVEEFLVKVVPTVGPDLPEMELAEMGMPVAKVPENTYLQIRVDLVGAKPPIWRRLVVPANIELGDLHWVLQAAMGWTNSHLHQYIFAEEYLQPPSPFSNDYSLCYEGLQLGNLVYAKGHRLRYEYDFGDGWEHSLLVEEVLKATPKHPIPYCLAGRQACPPEDSGGLWGYYDKLEAIKDPGHPDHQYVVEWVGADFDATAFDVREVNERLGKLKLGT